MAAKQEQELSLFELASAKLSDAQKLLAEARELLKQDLNNARQEKSAIEEITKTLNAVHFASTIKLNVGGKIYETTLDTLRKDPDSMLCAMFSGRFELKANERDGAYFIDRDGKLFRYILNYLRNGDLLCPEDRTVRKELLAEATFYQVQGIINHLKEKMSAFECSSIIETENHHSALISWLPPYATCSLLFRASDDGKTPVDFHRCCDNKGPTLVLIKSEEYIFGGYTVQSWDSGSSTKAIPDSQSFLFTLVNPSGNEPVKMAPKPGASILCNSNLGPTLGTTQYYDLLVWSVSSTNDSVSSHLDLGHGFVCPDSINKNSYFTGRNPFEISELEVFQVNL
ncbi:uncharacterized protein LOC110048052 isoform X3 [Orbicella faveolata]|uniref:uncharacterized protein LOC110048052 isoform X2 n=1 Tax=Orbicella faveolata TaxID=48498 RepID=UPI0009E622D1|nr:uncharacterized protein LOC110048052 isoform X2 [Orbicella faveolata]XP_020609480.1 uncharacterized protein LOC110048052 isoform X3 [Orbicella faveolata]